MILLPAEHSTEKRFTSTVCIGDKPKTHVRMLSVVITATATLMHPHMWKKKTICIWTCRHVVSHLVCSRYPKYFDVRTMQIDALAPDDWMSFLPHKLMHLMCLSCSSWPVRSTTVAALNRMEDFLTLSVRPEKRKCHQLRFYDIYCQSPHPHSFTPKLCMLVRATH